MLYPLVGRKVVDAAVGRTDLHVVAVPGVLGKEGVALLVQADNDELPQVLLALDRVLIHLERAQGQLSRHDLILAPPTSHQPGLPQVRRFPHPQPQLKPQKQLPLAGKEPNISHCHSQFLMSQALLPSSPSNLSVQEPCRSPQDRSKRHPSGDQGLPEGSEHDMWSSPFPSFHLFIRYIDGRPLKIIQKSEAHIRAENCWPYSTHKFLLDRLG